MRRRTRNLSLGVSIPEYLLILGTGSLQDPRTYMAIPKMTIRRLRGTPIQRGIALRGLADLLYGASGVPPLRHGATVVTDEE